MCFMCFKKNWLYLFSFILIQFKLFSQFTPKNNDILNYNQIMFEYPVINNAAYYKIFIAYSKTPSTINDFKTNLFREYSEALLR